MTETRRLNLGAIDLYGLIEELVRSEPQQPEAPGADVASNDDALLALAQLARAIEKPAQTGDLDPEDAHRRCCSSSATTSSPCPPESTTTCPVTSQR